MRHRLSYANVAATLALVFSMSGGALAATHYLINSTKQINPKVLKKLLNSSAEETSLFNRLAASASVLKAKTAESAGTAASAGSATSATTATHAATAENSAQLGGVAASGYLQQTAQPGQILTGQLAARYVAKSEFTPAAGSFPVPLPAGVAVPEFVYTQTTAPGEGCPGIGQVTVAGVLCVYGYNVYNIGAVGKSGDSEGENHRFGFSVDVFPHTESEAGFMLASWAYKVP